MKDQEDQSQDQSEDLQGNWQYSEGFGSSIQKNLTKGFDGPEKVMFDQLVAKIKQEIPEIKSSSIIDEGYARGWFGNGLEGELVILDEGREAAEEE